MDEELGYVSYGDNENIMEKHRISTDEANFDTLVSVRKDLNDTIESYSKNSRLDLTEKLFPIKDQLAINLEIAKRLKEVEIRIGEAVSKVREIQNERR